jgi:hypothetical protein
MSRVTARKVTSNFTWEMLIVGRGVGLVMYWREQMADRTFKCLKLLKCSKFVLEFGISEDVRSEQERLD